MSLHIQFATVGWMFLSGLMLGVIFDAYRVASGKLNFPRWVLPLLDLLYWIAATMFVFRQLYRTNNGEIRFYVFIGLALGCIAYYGFASRSFIRWFAKLIDWIKAFCRLLLRCFDVLIIAPALGLYRFSLILFGFLLAFVMFLGRLLIKLLYPIWKPLLWLWKYVQSLLISKLGIGRLLDVIKKWLRK